jgi:hypothetical protein
VVFLASALAALWWGGEVLADEEQIAQDLAVEYTDTVLFEALDADLLDDEIRGRQYRDLIIQVQGGIMTDEGVARVRIWAPDGTLLFSTESLEQIGVAKALNSEPIKAAVDGRATSVVSEATVEAKSGLTGSTQRLFQTFAPIRVRERTAILGVAEVDRTYASISQAAEQPWRALQIGLGAAALLCALLYLLSLRSPTSTLGTGIGVTPPRLEAPPEPVPADRNPLRLRNELEREREANRRLQAELEATVALGPPTTVGPPPGSASAEALEEAHAAEVAEAAKAAHAAHVAEAEAAARLADAESALADAGAHTAELERALADARAQAVAPEALASLEERVIAAEVRAREAELRLRELNSAPPEPPGARSPTAAPATSAQPESDPDAPENVADDPSPQAMDLRSRLARTAARKKLGSHPDDDQGS